MTKPKRSRETLFRFRQFSVDQRFCAMKVGTDGVLLGAWAGKKPVQRILDIGTGSGLLALMLAQRFPGATIHAIEKEPKAVQQALLNVANSSFATRIQVFEASLQEWQQAALYSYDLLVCNPPFYQKGWLIDQKERRMARDMSFLPPSCLFASKGLCAAGIGSLALVYPFTEKETVVAEAARQGWYLSNLAEVFTNQTAVPERLLMEWQTEPCLTRTETIHIQGEQTFRYRQLVEPFYL